MVKDWGQLNNTLRLAKSQGDISVHFPVQAQIPHSLFRV